MSTIYRRYFRVTEGPLIQATNDITEQREKASEAIMALAKEVGATDARTFHDGRFAGFVFEQDPGTKWKRLRSGGYYPKKNSTWGRELAKRITDLPRHESIAGALRAVGLVPHSPALIDESRSVGLYVTLTGSQKLGVWFVSVPWRDEDPAEIEQYKKDRAAGTRFCVELAHLCWEPPAELHEVKHWEVLKEIEEMNQALKEA